MSETPILTLRNIARSFGDLKVLQQVDLDVLPGEVLGLIGPNGAGKTSLFNIITGFLEPDHGAVQFAGQDMRGTSPEARVRRGLVRSFQSSTIFAGLTLRENLALAIRAHRGDAYRWWRAGKACREADRRADEMLAAAGLAAEADKCARDLSHGTNRLLDVLIALALEPRLLLLDEPTAGLSRAEADAMLALLRRHDREMTIVMVAHDLDIVFSFCDRVAVLDLGRTIAIGTPAAIRDNPRVQQAYLGTPA